MQRPPVSRSVLTSAAAALLMILAAAGCTPPDAERSLPPASQKASLPDVADLLAPPTRTPIPTESLTPQPLETSEDSDSGTPTGRETTAGSSALPLPPEAFNPDIDGTLPVIQHFFDAWRMAYLEADTGPLLDISAGRCAYCVEIVTLAELYTADGATGSGGGIDATSVRRAARADTDAQGWRMDLVMDAVAFDSPDGVNMMIGGFSDHVFIELVWEDERWLISDVTSFGTSDTQSDQ